jgi:hypothetical protein
MEIENIWNPSRKSGGEVDDTNHVSSNFNEYCVHEKSGNQHRVEPERVNLFKTP